MRLLCLFTCLFTSFQFVNAQQPNLKLIEGGTFMMGGGYQYENRDYRMHLLGIDSAFSATNSTTPAIGEIPEPNNPTRQVTVSSFYLAEKEVTNLQYREFLMDSLLSSKERMQMDEMIKAQRKASTTDGYQIAYADLIKKAEKAGLAPDQQVWATDFPFSYNKPLVSNYFNHPAFDEYPVVGVTWAQANAYCQWLTTKTNRELAKQGKPIKPAYRLPTEAEWEYAAAAILSPEPETAPSALYPFSGRSLVDNKGQYKMNIKVGPGDYIGDNYEYTSPVGAFQPNAFGLYDMGGNVAEWTQDIFRPFNKESGIESPKRINQGEFDLTLPQSNIDQRRVTKGGSWADYCYAAMCGSRAAVDPSRGHSRVGFRVAMIKAE